MSQLVLSTAGGAIDACSDTERRPGGNQDRYLC